MSTSVLSSVCNNDLPAKKCVLFAHIHEYSPSTIRQRSFVHLACQPSPNGYIVQLYLDERHIDWMSDVVLQHVLADLRPLIIPKLQAEKDVHFGPGVTPGNKRGIVEVHRGETYQFAYFFRKTEPHTILFKSRYFTIAPLAPRVVPKPASAQLVDRNPQQKGLRTRVPGKQSKRKRAKSQARDKNTQSHRDEDEWSAEESEDNMDDAGPVPREPRPVRKQRRIVDVYLERDDDDDDAEDMYQDVTMDSPPLEMDGGSVESPSVSTVKDGDAAASSANDQPSAAADIELVVEEEEDKPKPLLKLKYQSFPTSGHCLCVVVEPWPPLRTETRLPVGLGASLQRGRLEPSLPPSNETVIAGRRAKTPLFLPEYGRAPSESPVARDGTLPPARTEDSDHSDDDLMNFSQALNAAGYMHAIAADDDDDMDGAVLFGDADEVRELF